MKFDSLLNQSMETVNHEGEKAYLLTHEMELYTAVVTTELSDSFYENVDERINRINSLVSKVSPEFVAKLAVYARTKMQLRSVPLLLVVALARVHNGDDLVARTIERVVNRADEIMELPNCYALINGATGIKKLGKLSHQIQVGLQRAFNKFDEYQFAKYNRTSSGIKLRDALFVVHPKPKDDAQQAIFDKIVSDTLDTPYTWETELSALGERDFGSDSERETAYREKWTELIRSNKVGYMALLRNLRNILRADVDIEDVKHVCDYLSDEKSVLNSKQFPFRFFSAYRELDKYGKTICNEPAKFSLATIFGGANRETLKRQKISTMLASLESAMKVSAANIEGFGEDTRLLMACDVSGSMYSHISKRSSVRCYDVGIVLAMLLRERCKKVITGIFGDIWKVLDFPRGEILSAVSEMERHNGEVGYSTNGFEVLKWLVENRVVVDKVMMFTDCQMWNSMGTGRTFSDYWKQYKTIAPKAELYVFDLVGYGQMPLRVDKGDVYIIAGWSDRIFEVVKAIKEGSSVIDVINSIEL